MARTASLLLLLALPAVVAAQGRCRLTPDAPACSPAAISPVFAPTGWRTTALDAITFRVADPQAEAAFYTALLGWRVRSVTPSRIVMDIDTWGTAVIEPFPIAKNRTSGQRAEVTALAFGVTPWDETAVAQALRARGVAVTPDADGGRASRVRLQDPDGFPLVLRDAQAVDADRRATPAGATPALRLPFASTGWRTVWLDHVSYTVANYKRSASFYVNLLGWMGTYDEGSQEELLMGDVGNIVVRGGNPLAPGRAAARSSRVGRVDHLSFGITPWNTDDVRRALVARHLSVRVDTADGSDPRTARYVSLHTRTPNGFDLQLSGIQRETRLTLSTVVRPRR